MDVLDSAREQPTISIPAISNKRLLELSARIRPLIVAGDSFCTIEPVDLRTQSFLWDPKVEDLVRPTTLRLLGQVQTLHTCGYPGFFKPSVAEVLAQLPKAWEAEAIFFYTDTAGYLADDDTHNLGLTTFFAAA